jgi:copper homeostasis protein
MIKVEICCGSYEDALNAYKGGAKRIELNSALHLGGLTPSVSSLKLTKENTDLNVISMVRVRGAGFNYNNEQFIQIKNEVIELLENGSDGIAFGILDDKGNIDLERNKEIIDIIKKYNKEVVFHRAFDCSNDPYKSIEQLIDLGVDRVLTSGLKPKAIEGKKLLKDLQEKYGDKIELLVGSGVNETNIKELYKDTLIKQYHSSCKEWIVDNTTIRNGISYGFNGNKYDIVSKEKVSLFVQKAKEIGV